MTLTQGTGTGLPDLFADLRDDVETAFIGFAPATRRGGHAIGGSVTMPLHVREGINVNCLASGVLMAGTASGDEHWAGDLVAARGRLVMLDSGRISTDGLRRPLTVFDGRHRIAALRLMLSETAAAGLWSEPPVASAPDPLDDDQNMGAQPQSMQQMARSMTEVAAAVAVERPAVPALTDQPLENVRRLFALTAGQLADLFGVTERQTRRYLREGLPDSRRPLADALTAVGLTVIGGLGARGAQRWLFSGSPTAARLAADGRIDELRDRAEALRDSPAT